MASILKNKKFTIIFLLLMTIASIFGIYQFGFNLGPTWNDSSVLIFQVDHEISTDNISTELASIYLPSRIEKESTSKFYAYYQNISDNDKEKVLNEIEGKISGIIEKDFYSYSPAKQILLNERAILVMLIVFLLSFIYFLLQLKNSALTIKEITNFLIREILLMLIVLISLFGIISFIGITPYYMEVEFFVFTFVSILLIFLFEQYYIFRLKDYLKGNNKWKLIDIEENIVKNNWPEFIFLITLVFILLILPWLVISSSIIIATIQVIFTSLLIIYIFFIVRKHLLNFEIIKGNEFKRIKFMNKKW